MSVIQAAEISVGFSIFVIAAAALIKVAVKTYFAEKRAHLRALLTSDNEDENQKEKE